MTATGNNIPVSVDYTSRDYASLKADLIQRMQSRIPNWSGTDAADFGLALVEAFAYLGDNLSYYIDRIANESYIYTATQRASILNIARSYGYSPAGYRTSYVEVTFTNETTTSITIPKGTQLQATVSFNDVVEQLIFTTASELVLDAGVLNLDDSITPSTGSVLAYQGEDISYRTENLPISENDIAGETVAVSDGTAGQQYPLSEAQVVDGTVSVYVQNGDTYELWTQVLHLNDYGPNDAVYSLTTDANDYVYVVFGDGVAGAIPTNNGTIKAIYVTGGGVIANVSANLINTIYSMPGVADADLHTISSSVTVTNSSPAQGGQDPEDNDSIRYNAPQSLTSLNRAVSIKDFSSLAYFVAQVGKANATAAAPTSVTLYVSPQRNFGDTELYPSYTTDPSNGGVLTPEWLSIQSSVSSFFTDKTQIGTTLTVSPPIYTLVNMHLQYTALPQYTPEVVLKNIKAKIVSAYSYSNTNFEDIVTPEDVEYTLRGTEGLSTVKVTALYRYGESAGRKILIGNPGELFVFDPSSMTFDLSVLSSIVPSVGTLSPTYSAGTLNYTLALPNGTSSITLTPTHIDSAATITVNGIATASGSPSASITTNVGTTYISVVSYASDGVKTYQIAATRTA